MIRFILIHGTWARDATWVNRDSALGKRLAEEFPQVKVAEPFRWSGANQFKARHVAAQDFVEHLRRSADGDRFILIAHSHGGSVVHYAHRIAPELMDRKVVGVACMATPFFGFSMRPGYAALTAGLIGIASLLLLHLLMAGTMAMSHHYRWRLDDDLSRFFYVVAFEMTLLTGLIGTVFKSRRRVYDWLARSTRRLEKWETATISLPRVAFFRSMGDEVALALSTGQFLTTVTNRALGILAAVADRGVRLVARLSGHWPGRIGLGVAALAMTIAAALPPAIQVSLGFQAQDFRMLLWIYSNGCGIEDAPWMGHAICALAQAALWLDLALLALTLLLVGLLVLGWLCSFLILRFFGTWSATAALVSEFAIEPVPDGVHRFCNTGWSRDMAALRQERPALQHSDPYSSEGSQQALCDWVRTLLRT